MPAAAQKSIPLRVRNVLEAPVGGSIQRIRASGSNDQGRRSIVVDGSSVCTLPTEVIESLSLHTGMRWTPELAMRIARAVEDDQMRQVIKRLLAVRLRSKGELVDRLKRAGARDSKAVALVDELERQGSINDTTFAQAYARSIVSRKPAGARLIEQKLRQKRVDPVLSRAAAQKALAGRDLEAEALALATKKLRLMPPSLAQPARIRRLYGQLARRGFDAALTDRIVRRLLKSPEQD